VHRHRIVNSEGIDDQLLRSRPRDSAFSSDAEGWKNSTRSFDPTPQFISTIWKLPLLKRLSRVDNNQLSSDCFVTKGEKQDDIRIVGRAAHFLK
jgi:hypothetical protein